jgi:uracil phosphoribosyltransferase
VTVVDHALAGHLLAQLRTEGTAPPVFRTLAKRLALTLALEAIRDLPTTEIPVHTPLEETTGRVLGDLVAVPILRAGLGMLDATIRMVPTATVALLGLRRDHVTLQPALYANTIPASLDGRTVFLLDPMLATGGSAAFAASVVVERGARSVHSLSIVAAPEGLARMEADCPSVDVWVAALDPRLDENGYIVPGLGDAGDRLYGQLD